MNWIVVANVSKYYNQKGSEDVQLLVETYRSVKIIIMMKIRLKCRRRKIFRNLTKLSLWEKKEFYMSVILYAFDILRINAGCLYVDCLLFMTLLHDLRLDTLLKQHSSRFLVPLAPRPLKPVTNSARSNVPNRVLWLGEALHLNLLKPFVYFVHLQLQHSKFLHFTHRVNLCVSNESRKNSAFYPTRH